MRRVLLVLSCLVPGIAAAQGDSDRLCKSMSLEPAPCYARWAPNVINLMNIGISIAAGDKKEFTGEAAFRQENDLYAYTRKAMKPGSERAAALDKAHKYAQESYRAILPRKGVSEADRKKDADRRQAELARLVEKLAK